MRLPFALSLVLIGCGSEYCGPSDDRLAVDSAGDVDDGSGSGSDDSSAACDGVNVPGDYAVLQDALDAVAGSTDATICLGPGELSATHLSGQLVIRGMDDKTLRIVGSGRDETFVKSTLAIEGGWTTVNISHLSTAGVEAYASGVTDHVEIEDSRISVRANFHAGELAPLDVAITRTELAAITIDVYKQPMNVELTNSVITGVLDASTYSPTQFTAPLTISIVNDTFVGAGATFRGHTTAMVANSIITGAPVALSWNAYASVTGRNNALWGNTADYADLASEGDHYVTADCLLDLSGAIPTLNAGSPCIDAADSTLAPDHDYANHPRGAQPDIGAVEM